MQVRNWLHVERPLPRRSTSCCESGERRRDLQHRRPRRAAEHRRRAPDPRAHRPRRVADRVRHRPARPRPPLLARLGEDSAGSAGSRGRLRRGPRARRSSGTATTPGGGSRSAPATTASTTSASTARKLAAERAFTAPRDPARGPRLVEPSVHRRRPRLLLRDLPRERLRGARHRRRVRAGQPFALARGTRCAPCTSSSSRARRSWCAPRAARSTTSRSTCAATRRPTASTRHSS